MKKGRHPPSGGGVGEAPQKRPEEHTAGVDAPPPPPRADPPCTQAHLARAKCSRSTSWAPYCLRGLNVRDVACSPRTPAKVCGCQTWGWGGILRAEAAPVPAPAPPPPPPYGVLWGTQARELSKTKFSSVVPEGPVGLEKDVQRRGTGKGAWERAAGGGPRPKNSETNSGTNQMIWCTNVYPPWPVTTNVLKITV